MRVALRGDITLAGIVALVVVVGGRREGQEVGTRSGRLVVDSTEGGTSGDELMVALALVNITRGRRGRCTSDRFATLGEALKVVGGVGKVILLFVEGLCRFGDNLVTFKAYFMSFLLAFVELLVGGLFVFNELSLNFVNGVQSVGRVAGLRGEF